jgi:addiction module HigA family antidote
MKKKLAEPREVLRKEFLKPLKITQYRLAKETYMTASKVSAIMRGNRAITVDTALKLGCFFCNGAEFWLELQHASDIRKRKRVIKETLKKIRPIKTSEKA